MFRYFLLLLLLQQIVLGQNKVNSARLHSDYVLKQNRTAFKENFVNRVNNMLRSKPNAGNEKAWINTLVDAELLYYKSDVVYNAIKTGLDDYKNRSAYFNRGIVEAAYALYPVEFNEEVYKIYNSTKSNEVFANSVHYLKTGGYNGIDNTVYANELKERFTHWENDPILLCLYKDLMIQEASTPPLDELLSHPFQKGKTIIYSLHRKDRTYPGITIIKKPDGKFVKDDDGGIFNVRQLALSATNLPGYLKNGNTPQGIYSVVGFYVSPTESIGPTPNVITRIPYEVPPSVFYHNNQNDNRWGMEDYKNLLPENWKDYSPVYEAYYAGKKGRRLIVMHGSTDDLSYYEHKPFYPLTPTRGCLTTVEIWDGETGKNIRSDQTKLINAYFDADELKGFLVVIDIDDKKEPVTLEEILPYIKKGGK